VISPKRAAQAKGKGQEGGIPCLWFPAPKAATVIVFFHGNAEDLGMCFAVLKHMRNQFKVNVLGVEYPGYGLLQNERPSEESVCEVALTAFRYLVDKERMAKYLDSLQERPGTNGADSSPEKEGQREDDEGSHGDYEPDVINVDAGFDDTPTADAGTAAQWRSEEGTQANDDTGALKRIERAEGLLQESQEIAVHMSNLGKLTDESCPAVHPDRDASVEADAEDFGATAAPVPIQKEGKVDISNLELEASDDDTVSFESTSGGRRCAHEPGGVSSV